MFNPRKFKDQQRIVWSELAPRYDLSFSTIMHPAALQLIDDAGIREGFQVLDVATGTGTCALMAGARVGSSGRVVGIDFAPGMIEQARTKAAARRLTNTEFLVMDAEKLELPDGSFDAAICKIGLPHFPDCHQALREVLRVLRPGAKLVALVLGRPEASPFVTMAARTAAKTAPSLVTHESGGPSDFQFGGEGTLDAAFNAAGFVSVASRRLVVMVTCADGDCFFDLFANGAGNFAYKLSRLDPLLRDTVRREIVAAAERHQSADGIRLPMEIVIGWGEKPKGSEEVAVPRPRSWTEVLEEGSDVPQLAPLEASRLLSDANAVILDVRAGADYRVSHLPGAKHVPRGLLESKIGKLISPQKVSAILVYCGDGKSSSLACHTLRTMGYPSVKNLSGGLEAWLSMGGPVVSEESR